MNTTTTQTRSKTALLEAIARFGRNVIGVIDAPTARKDSSGSGVRISNTLQAECQALWAEAYETFVQSAVAAGGHDETPLVKALFAIYNYGFYTVQGPNDTRGDLYIGTVHATQMREVLAAMPKPSGETTRYVTEGSKVHALRLKVRKDGFQVLDPNATRHHQGSILSSRQTFPTPRDALLAAQASNVAYLARLENDLAQAKAQQANIEAALAKEN